MLYHFDFDSKYKILRCRFDGGVTDEDLKDFYRLAAEFVERTDPRGAIIDFSAVTSFEVSPETIRELAKTTPVMQDPDRLRCIIAPSAQVFGMARMFELEGESTRPNLHVVRTQEQALALLGVQEPQFEPVRSNTTPKSST